MLACIMYGFNQKIKLYFLFGFIYSLLCEDMAQKAIVMRNFIIE